MPTACEELLSVLREEKWVNKLRSAYDDIFEEVYKLDVGYPEDPVEHRHLKGDWEQCCMYVYRHKYHNNSPITFKEPISQLKPPLIITEKELASDFLGYFKNPFNRSHFKKCYEHFLDHVNHRLLARHRSASLDCCVIYDLKPNRSSDCQNLKGSEYDYYEMDAPLISTRVLWSSNGDLNPGPQVRLLANRLRPVEYSRRLEQSSPELYILEIVFDGAASSGALTRLTNQLIPAIRSSLRSIELLDQGGTSMEAWEESIHIIEEFEIYDMPYIRAEHFEKYIPFVRDCCNAIVAAKPSKKWKWPTRIGNAAKLLALADQQLDSSISLALSIGAIEALLGNNEQELSDKLARRIAGLLEPDPAKRAEVIECFKEIYNKRSKILHGSEIDDNNTVKECKNNARMLAAGVLYVIQQRDAFIRREINSGVSTESENTPEKYLELLLRRVNTGEKGLPWDHNTINYGMLEYVRKLWGDVDAG